MATDVPQNDDIMIKWGYTGLNVLVHSAFAAYSHTQTYSSARRTKLRDHDVKEASFDTQHLETDFSQILHPNLLLITK